MACVFRARMSGSICRTIRSSALKPLSPFSSSRSIKTWKRSKFYERVCDTSKMTRAPTCQQTFKWHFLTLYFSFYEPIQKQFHIPDTIQMKVVKGLRMHLRCFTYTKKNKTFEPGTPRHIWPLSTSPSISQTILTYPSLDCTLYVNSALVPIVKVSRSRSINSTWLMCFHAERYEQQKRHRIARGYFAVCPRRRE